MNQAKETEPSKEQPYLLRKKINRMEQSRDVSKSKNRELAKSLKAKQKREVELIDNRDSWKAKCREQVSKNEDLEFTLKRAVVQLQGSEEQLNKVLSEFKELKKKHKKESRKSR